MSKIRALNISLEECIWDSVYKSGVKQIITTKEWKTGPPLKADAAEQLDPQEAQIRVTRHVDRRSSPFLQKNERWGFGRDRICSAFKSHLLLGRSWNFISLCKFVDFQFLFFPLGFSCPPVTSVPLLFFVSISNQHQRPSRRARPAPAAAHPNLKSQNSHFLGFQRTGDSLSLYILIRL